MIQRLINQDYVCGGAPTSKSEQQAVKTLILALSGNLGIVAELMSSVEYELYLVGHENPAHVDCDLLALIRSLCA